MSAWYSIEHANSKIRSDARRDVAVTVIISFLPLILAFLYQVSESNSVLKPLANVFFSGGLYFYAMSLCASIYILAQIDNHESNLSMRIWSGVFVISCGIFMAFFVGQSGPESSEPSWLHGSVSSLFLIGSVFLFFIVKVLSENPPPKPDDVDRARASAVQTGIKPKYD